VVVRLCLSDSNENFVFAFAFSHHGTLSSSKSHDRVWKAVREHKPWWWALLGSLTLVVYGFLPTLQPTDSFGRVYAVYGGFFIVLSYIWGMIFDGMKPDLGDVVGAGLALVAVLVILFWPRQQ